MKVLVVEGGRRVSDDIVNLLQKGQHEVVRGITRENAKASIHSRGPHLVVLVAVPFMSWQLQLLHDLQEWEQTPYLLAVAPAEPPDLVALLEAGADASCSYPPAPGLFEAQVGALDRRVRAAAAIEPPTPEVVTVRDLTVDFSRYAVSFGTTPLALTPAEFRILASLARRPGKVVPTDTLSNEALGHGLSGQQAKDVLKVHVRRIRNKIGEAGGSRDYIWNIRGFGYLLERRTPGRARPGEENAEEEASSG